jgi:hypothetical protein
MLGDTRETQMSPASYLMLKSQVEIVDELIQNLGLLRSETQELLDAGFRTAITDTLDVAYRLMYDGKVKLLSQMEHPCAVG